MLIDVELELNLYKGVHMCSDISIYDTDSMSDFSLGQSGT